MIKSDPLQEKILNAAQRRMIAYGYHKVTMDEISQDLRMSKNTIYKQFASKEEIARCLVARLQDDITGALDIIEKSQDDPLQIFSGSVLTLRRQLGPWFEHFFREIPVAVPDLWDQFLHYRNGKILEIRSLIEAGIKKGQFRNIPSAIAVQAYLGAVKAIVNPRFLEEEQLTFSQALDAVQDVWARGILLRK